MDELISATNEWLATPDDQAVDFNIFLEGFYATHPLPPAPEAHEAEEEFEIEFEVDNNMTDAEFWNYVNR